MSDRAASLSGVPGFLRPLVSLARSGTLGGVFLILASAVALLWANSPWRDAYLAVLDFPIVVGFGSWVLEMEALHWINDLLMAFFFLLVAMGIKRELLTGELSSLSKAFLPLFAALGGMLVPAALFSLVASGGEAARGWGVPMATDIAFAIGVLRILGNRIPRGLFAFLAALAIIDDLGAIVVIALFYSSTLSWAALGSAALATAVLVAMNRFQVRRPGLYILVGLPLWIAILNSGVHATIAGVIVAFCIPARGRAVARGQLLEESQALGRVLSDPGAAADQVDVAAGALRETTKKLESPLAALERAIAPYVNFLIVPLFGLANAGVGLVVATPLILLKPAALGVIVGLVFGKPIGVIGATLLTVKLKITQIPDGVGRRHMIGAGVLAGIGFTMSLFVAGLAFEPNSLLHTETKVGILTGSIIAGTAGYLVLRSAPAVREADESEGHRAAGGMG